MLTINNLTLAVIINDCKRFNPRDRNEIKGTGTAVKNPDIIRVRDFNLARKNEPAWRSFNVNSIRRINCNRQTFDFTV